MHPILIDFGTHVLPILGSRHLFLPTYGLLFAVGVVVAWWWFMRRAAGLGVEPEPAFNLTFYTVLAGLLGAKLTLIVVDWRYYASHPLDILWTIRAAGVLMGGVAAGAATFVLYARRRGLPLLRLGDAIAAPLALAQSIGRLGCLSAGCCWGVPANGLWCAITFTDPAAAAQTGVPLQVPLVPTQAIQMLNDLVLAVVLALLYRAKLRPDGTVFWIYLLLYSLTRGVIEFWRGDAQRGVYFGGAISTSQGFALVGIAVALVMLALGRVRRPSTSPS